MKPVTILLDGYNEVQIIEGHRRFRRRRQTKPDRLMITRHLNKICAQLTDEQFNQLMAGTPIQTHLHHNDIEPATNF